MIEYLVAFLIILMFINLFKRHKNEDINQATLLHVRDQMNHWFIHMQDYSKKIDDHTKLIVEQDKVFKKIQIDLRILNLNSREKNVVDKYLDNRFPAMHNKKRPKLTNIIKLKKEKKDGNDRK